MAPGNRLAPLRGAAGCPAAGPGVSQVAVAPSEVLVVLPQVLVTLSKVSVAPAEVSVTLSKVSVTPSEVSVASSEVSVAPSEVWEAAARSVVAWYQLFLSLFFPIPTLMRKLLTNFDNVAKMEIGPLAQNCLTSLAGNPRYPQAKPQAEEVQAALAPYQAAASIAHPTPTQTAELAQLRTALNQALTAVATLANALYPADEAALLSTGLSLSKQPERRTTLEVPVKFQLVDGPQPGTLCAKAKRPPHAVALKYLYTLTPTDPDIEWYTVVVRDGDALLTRCQSADRVYCKVAAVGGDTDQQPYTDVLSRIVQ